MKVLKLNAASPSYLKKEIIRMTLEFQEILDEGPDEYKIKKGLEAILDKDKPGHVFVLSADNGDTAGMVYCNIGSGMSAGGLYLWINGVYVRKKFQGEGAGSFFLNEILQWARSKGCVSVFASRDLENEASDRLFSKAGFKQHQCVLMDRRID